MMKRSLIALSVSVMLGGCASLPDDATPAVTPLDTQQLGLDAAAPKPADGNWWTSFNDPQLDTLVQHALAHSPSLDAALAQLRSAQAQAGQALANSRPDVTLSGSETRERLSGNFEIPPPYGGHTYWVGSLTANLSWDLDFWGRQKALVASANTAVHASTLDQAAARLAVSGGVTRAYLALYRAQLLLDIAQQQQKQRQDELDLTQARVTAGLETELALRNAQALLPQARAAVLVATNARDLAVHQLAALTGQGPSAYDAIAQAHPDLEAALPLPDKLPLDLLSRRPDVLAARARVEADKSMAKAARAAFYPDISLSALAGYQSLDIGKMLDSDSATFGAGAAVNLPLFDAGRLREAYRGSIAAEDAAIASYNQAVLDAVQESADALSNIGSLAAQREQWQQTLAAAQSALDLAHSNYKAGLSTQLDVLDAEGRWLDAKRSIANLDVDLAVARVNLLLAIGGSFDPDTLNSTGKTGASS